MLKQSEDNMGLWNRVFGTGKVPPPPQQIPPRSSTEPPPSQIELDTRLLQQGKCVQALDQIINPLTT
jgi:hypothetical protein